MPFLINPLVLKVAKSSLYNFDEVLYPKIKAKLGEYCQFQSYYQMYRWSRLQLLEELLSINGLNQNSECEILLLQGWGRGNKEGIFHILKEFYGGILLIFAYCNRVIVVIGASFSVGDAETTIFCVILTDLKVGVFYSQGNKGTHAVCCYKELFPAEAN